MTAIGVLGLDTSFTKIPGHIRNPVTFGFPVIVEVVTGATPQRVVQEADPALLEPFTKAAQKLEAAGAAAITSACGFLAMFQPEMAAAVDVPLYASSLIQLPMVHRMMRPGQKVGVLSASAGSLTPRHFAAVGAADVPVRVAGMEDQPEFREAIMEESHPTLNVSRLRAEVLSVAGSLARPDVGALVLECTDLAPFAADIQHLTGLPVFDIVTLTEMVHDAVARRPYAAMPPS
jgi:aspartate/glutamate racemase